MPWSAPLVGPGLAVDLSRPTDLSWRVRFDEPVGKAFGIPPPRATAFQSGSFIGDVRRGGSCNCETYVITPHGDGTHTEGAGHLLAERVPVVEQLSEVLIPALLITVTPVRLDSVDDAVSGNHAPADRVVDQLSLEDVIARALPAGFPARALVVRSQPPRQAYGESPPYFTVDAALAVREHGFDHLLVDLPSLDRSDDGGILGAHRAFFDLPAHAKRLPRVAAGRTVTEMCAVPASLLDGGYALSLQLAPLQADAVPSRPLLFPLVHSPVTFAGATAGSRP